MSWLVSYPLYLVRAAVGKFDTVRDQGSSAMSKIFHIARSKYKAKEIKHVIILHLFQIYT